MKDPTVHQIGGVDDDAALIVRVWPSGRAEAWVHSYAVGRWCESWPCSGLKNDRDVWAAFDECGDLVDVSTTDDVDGQAFDALITDAFAAVGVNHPATRGEPYAGGVDALKGAH